MGLVSFLVSANETRGSSGAASPAAATVRASRRDTPFSDTIGESPGSFLAGAVRAPSCSQSLRADGVACQRTLRFGADSGGSDFAGLRDGLIPGAVTVPAARCDRSQLFVPVRARPLTSPRCW